MKCRAVHPGAGAAHLKTLTSSCASRGTPGAPQERGRAARAAAAKSEGLGKQGADSSSAGGVWFAIETTECFKSGLLGL